MQIYKVGPCLKITNPKPCYNPDPLKINPTHPKPKTKHKPINPTRPVNLPGQPSHITPSQRTLKIKSQTKRNAPKKKVTPNFP